MNKIVQLEQFFSEVKAADTDDEVLTITGVANSTSKDRGGDVVLEEAWKKGGLQNFLKNPIVLFQHNHSAPIGTVTDLTVTGSGLEVTAEISKAAGNVYSLIKNGILKAFSIGFMIKDADYDSDEDTFFIKDLELLELSVVSVPMNQDSVFSLKKSFGSDTEYEEFKKEILDSAAGTEEHDSEANVEEASEDATAKSQEELEQLINTRIKEALDAKEAENAEENIEENDTMSDTDIQVKEGVEKLLEDFEARLKAAEDKASDAQSAADVQTEETANIQKELDDMAADLKEKEAELKAFQEQKSLWEAQSAARDKVSEKEIDTAVLVAKALGRPITETKYFNGLREKVGAHLTNMTEDWESEFSTRVWDDMRSRLVVEPMFETIPMNTPTLHVPVNPEAGTAQWIGSASFRSTDGSSTGTAVDHTLIDETMVAYKLVTKEYLGYEEEEDSIIPLVGIVREAMARRMARSADIALLRGAASGATDPISGLTNRANTDGKAVDGPSAGSGVVAVSDLQALRRQLGKWGLNPSDVMYVVSQDAYYDLLEDPDFRTIDMVGDRATILAGQIGFANGSPIMVSQEYAAKADNAYWGVAVHASNFKVGNLRSMLVERDRNIEDQKNILVASRRMAFHQVIVGDGVAAGRYTA